MNTAPAIVLLAAGEGARFGSPKQLASVDGEPMLRRSALQALACGRPVIVVLGAQADRVAPALADLPVQIVVHAGWRDGMGSSLAAGVRAVQREHADASGVLLVLADQPRLGDMLLRHLLAEHERLPTHIIGTMQAGRVGPPIVFPRGDFDALAVLDGPHGPRELLQSAAARVVAVDAAAHLADLSDIDTPGDLARLGDRLR
jgi:CTP:molybdopterin cytidylyltransferase MocA